LAGAVIAFLDSSALIYYFEGDKIYKQAALAALQIIKAQDPGTEIAISRLAWMECRVKPLREANTQLLALYDSFFAQVRVVELSATVVERATQLRASTALKTPDALQAACALSLGADCFFVTGEAGFARVQGLKVQLVTVS
jgi:predicted nucleic acid-binding protein